MALRGPRLQGSNVHGSRLRRVALCLAGAALLGLPFTACFRAPGGGLAGALRVHAPSLSPDPGEYDHDIEITLSTETEGSTIRYVTDGTDPTMSGETYTEPFTLEGDREEFTVIAYAEHEGMQASPQTRGVYTIEYPTLPEPTFNPAGGNAASPLQRAEPIDITISVAGHTDAEIYYNIGGGQATRDHTPYNGAVPLHASGTYTVNAFAVKDGFRDSPSVSHSYELDLGDEAEPTFHLADGTQTVGATFWQDVSIELRCATPGATIYHTVGDNPDTVPDPRPSAEGIEYDGTPITLTGDAAQKTIRAVATAPDRGQSNIATETFVVEYPELRLNTGGGGTVAIAGGGSGPIPVEYGVPVEISATPEDSYTFDGWTIQSGTESAITIADASARTTTVTLEATDAVLGAAFSLQDQVTYNGNGFDVGTVPTDSTNYPAGAEAAVADPGDMGRVGYIFAGWNTESDGSGTAYDPGDSVTVSASGVILYAQWTSIDGVVTINNPTVPTFSLSPTTFTLQLGGGTQEQTITVAPGPDVTISSYEWFVNETSRATSDIISLDTAANPDWFALGANTLTLVVEIDGLPYSENFFFTVEQY